MRLFVAARTDASSSMMDITGVKGKMVDPSKEQNACRRGVTPDQNGPVSSFLESYLGFARRCAGSGVRIISRHTLRRTSESKGALRLGMTDSERLGHSHQICE